MKKNHEKNAHKAGHPYHENEMEHHRMLDKAREANMKRRKEVDGIDKHSPMNEHKAPHHLLGGVINDDHQQGIARKIQRAGDMPIAQHGSMADGWRHDRRDE